MIGVSNDRIFRRLCLALGHPEWAVAPQYSDQRAARGAPGRARRANQRRARGTSGGALERRVRRARGAGGADPERLAGARRSPGAGARAARRRGAARAQRHGERAEAPARVLADAGQESGSPPALGEHGLEILQEAGYTAAEIAELVAGGVCGTPGAVTADTASGGAFARTGESGSRRSGGSAGSPSGAPAWRCKGRCVRPGAPGIP